MATKVDEVRVPRPEVRPKTTAPVQWFAAGGVVAIFLILYSVTRWIIGGHAHSTPTGPTPVPTYMLVAVRIHDIVFPIVAVIAIYKVLYKPWRDERRLTTDGVLLICATTFWWLSDPLANYGRVAYLYNAAAVNLGCPQCFLPGWQSRGADTYVEPILWGQFFYIGILIFVMQVGGRLLSRYRQRWPHHSRLRTFMAVYAVALLFNLLAESTWFRLGLFTYQNVPWAIWSDHYYRVSLLEIPFGGLWYAALIACRYFTNDKGETLGERGLSELRVSPAKRVTYRILGSLGMYTMATWLAFFIPFGFLSWTNNDPWPQDIVKRSYFTQGLCGPHTEIACIDPRLPVPSGPDSAYFSPDGKLVVPKGLPVQTAE